MAKTGLYYCECPFCGDTDWADEIDEQMRCDYCGQPMVIEVFFNSETNQYEKVEAIESRRRKARQ